MVQDELHALRRIQNTQSIIMGLPTEILVHIFRFASLSGVPPGYEDEEMYDETFMRHTRTAIASTCSHWREIALDDSLLWQVIYLPWDLWPSKPPVYKCIDLEVKRCKQSTFSFKIQATKSELHTLVPILQSNIHRIEDLDILWMDHIAIDSFRVFEETPNEMLKSLRRLCLSSVNWNYPPDGEEIHLASAGALKELSMHNEFEAVDPDDFELGESWTIYPPVSCVLELINLSGWIPAESVINLINSCSALQSLVWNTTGVEEEKDLFFTGLKSLPTLKNLRIGRDIPLPWLAAIDAANLNHLHLSPQLHAPSSNKIIPGVVFPKLTSLTIENICDPATIIRFLQHHPSLRVLELMAVEPTVKLYNYLGSTKASDSALMKLECLIVDLDFQECANEDSQEYTSMLGDILKSRSQAPSSHPPFELRYKERYFRGSALIDPMEVGFLLMMYEGMFNVVSGNRSTEWEWPQ